MSTNSDVKVFKQGIDLYNNIGKIDGIDRKWMYAVIKNMAPLERELKELELMQKSILKDFFEEGQEAIKSEKFDIVDKKDTSEEAKKLRETDSPEAREKRFNSSIENENLLEKHKKAINEYKDFLREESTMIFFKARLPDCMLCYTGLVSALVPMIIIDEDEPIKIVEEKPVDKKE